MELKQVIKERHSCRSYLPTPISDEVIKEIVESARLAPSSKNAQQWKFVCVKTDKESKDIAKIMQEFYIKNKEYFFLFSYFCACLWQALVNEYEPIQDISSDNAVDGYTLYGAVKQIFLPVIW